MITLRLPYPVSSNDVWARTANGMRTSDDLRFVAPDQGGKDEEGGRA